MSAVVELWVWTLISAPYHAYATPPRDECKIISDHVFGFTPSPTSWDISNDVKGIGGFRARWLVTNFWAHALHALQ